MRNILIFETEKDDNFIKLYKWHSALKEVIKLFLFSYEQENNLRSPLLTLKFFFFLNKISIILFIRFFILFLFYNSFQFSNADLYRHVARFLPTRRT